MTRIVEAVETFSVGPAQVRVVTDCTDDVSAVTRAEQQVVRQLVGRNLWPHDTVTLFVLSDLEPLVGQLRQMDRLPADALLRLPRRPMVNLYDPRRARECFIFVNRGIMEAEGFWNDQLAAEGLLAHEHAHPLSEAPATLAARSLKVTVQGPSALLPLAEHLGQTLSTGAVTELLANAFCLANGFGAALAHVDRVTLTRAAANLPQRAELGRRAMAAVAGGHLPPDEARPLLLLADAQIGLPFALEIAPFWRAGRTTEAEELEGLLTRGLFSAMAPEMAEAYRGLQAAYALLRPEWDKPAVEAWCGTILAGLSACFSEGGAPLVLALAPERQATCVESLS